MADADSESMNKHISRVSGAYLLLVVAGVLISWKLDEIRSVIPELTELDSAGISVTVLLGLVASAVGYVIILFGVHESVDNLLFGARSEVDTHICKEIRKAITSTLGKKKAVTDDDALRLFYSFVNQKDETWPALRSRAFEQWGEYYTSVNLIMISLVAIAVETLLIAMDSPDLFASVMAIVLLGFFSLLLLHRSQLRIRPKLMNSVAEPQLIMITKDQRKEFSRRVKARFGG